MSCHTWNIPKKCPSHIYKKWKSDWYASWECFMCNNSVKMEVNGESKFHFAYVIIGILLEWILDTDLWIDLISILYTGMSNSRINDFSVGNQFGIYSQIGIYSCYILKWKNHRYRLTAIVKSWSMYANMQINVKINIQKRLIFCVLEMDEQGNLVKRVRKKGEKDDDEESLYDYVSLKQVPLRLVHTQRFRLRKWFH